MNSTKRVVLIIAACILSAGMLFAQSNKIIKTTDGSKAIPDYIKNLITTGKDTELRSKFGIKKSERVIYGSGRSEDQKQAELQAKAQLYGIFYGEILSASRYGNSIAYSDESGNIHSEVSGQTKDFIYIMYSDSESVPLTQIEEGAVQVLMAWPDCNYSQVILNYGTEDTMTAVSFNTFSELMNFNWDSIPNVTFCQFIGIPAQENDMLTLENVYGYQLERSENGKKVRGWYYYYICSYNEAEYFAYLNALLKSMSQSAESVQDRFNLLFQ